MFSVKKVSLVRSLTNIYKTNASSLKDVYTVFFSSINHLSLSSVNKNLQNKREQSFLFKKLYQQCFNCKIKSSFHNSYYLHFNKDKKTSHPSKSIISSQSDAPISSDLKDIINKKFITEEDTLNANSKEAKTEYESNTHEKTEEKKGTFAKMFSKEHGWKFSMAFITSLVSVGVVYGFVSWGAPRRDENNQIMMKDPSTERLLPDPIQPPYYQPPYTLVIEMNGLLLHPEWTISTGWRYKKRPGLDYFIDQIKYPLFEVVLFTKEPFLSAAPLAASLDPQNVIQFKLYRESTKFVGNKHVKDLTYMNRDPSKIIMIDWDESSYSLQPRNALHRLKKWDGDENDSDLIYLAIFLKMIAASGVSDVRDVLDHYNKEIDPLDAFKLNQIKIKEKELKRQQELEQMREKKQKSPFSLWKR